MDLLPQIPEGSVHCCVTSPPYWGGMRDYGVSPSVWGGATSCQHVFHPEKQLNKRGPFVKSGLQGSGPRAAGARPRKVSQGAFCTQCNAWQGVLGNEPDPDLYVAHLMQVFDLVFKALHPQGALFINIDDSRTADRQWAAVPERLVLAMTAAGWRYEDSVIWRKSNHSPGSHTNRTVRCHEPVLIFNKGRDAYWDAFAIREKTSSLERQRRMRELIKGMDEGIFNIRGPGRTGQKPPGKGGALYSRKARIESSLSGLRNRVSVWDIPGKPFLYEMCLDCWKVYTITVRRSLNRNAEDQAICGCGAVNWFTHFATFPGQLAQLCIAASTSEKGACPHCGNPWRRILEKHFVKLVDNIYGKGLESARARHRNAGVQNLYSKGVKGYNELTHIGWRPGCECQQEDPLPCIVLDPFVGSGTTVVQAKRMGRHFYGIEISADAVELANNILMLEAGQLNLGVIT